MSTQPVTLANPGGLPACMGGWCGLRDCCGQAQALDRLAHRLAAAPAAQTAEARHRLERVIDRLQHGLQAQAQQQHQRCAHLALRLAALDPQRVLERGYAWLSDASGHALTRASAFVAGQEVQATLSDGSVPLLVR